MALQRPALSAVGFQLSISVPSRAFSQAPSRWRSRGFGRVDQPATPRPTFEKSIRIASKEVGTIPQDLGLLPSTFIMPTGIRNPSIIKHPITAARFQWARLLVKARDLIALVSYRLTYRKHVRLQRSKIVPTAVALHEQMYTALAEGDVRTLRKICADGLYDSFAARIASKNNSSRKKETAVWELVRATRRPRLMSHKGAWLGVEGAGLRQAVVRIASVQRLTRYAADGSVVPGSGGERELVEYLVVQRNMVDGAENPDWIVWGTVEDTTPETLEEWKLAELAG